MCIIIYKKKDRKLPKEAYHEAWLSNDDGGGMAYVENGEVVVDKGFMTFDAFYAAIERVEDKELVLHFRLSTHGGISKHNCHPFHFRSKIFPNYTWAVAHNGQLPWGSTKEKSDTHCFVDDLLFPHLDRDPFFLDSHSGRCFLERFIEKNNKLVIMRHDNETDKTEIYIMNEKLGHYAHKGCWFSNHTYVKWNGPKRGYADQRRSPDYDGRKDVFPARNFQDFHEDWSFTAEGDWTGAGFIRDPSFTHTKVWHARDSHRGREIIKAAREGRLKELAPPQHTAPKTLPDAIPNNVTPVNQDTPQDLEQGVIAKDLEAVIKKGPTEDLGDFFAKGGDTRSMVIANNPSPEMMRKSTELLHLNKMDRKVLKRAAADLFRDTVPEVTGFDNASMIIWMRSELREHIPLLKQYADDALDLKIVDDISRNSGVISTFIYPTTDAEVKNQGGI